MVVKKIKKTKVIKPKVKTRVTVKIVEVNKVIDKLADKLRFIQYGYTVNPELEELRKLFR